MSITQGQYTLELEQTARKYIATPVSFSGGFHIIWPLAKTESTGFRQLGRQFAVGTLLVLWWLLVTVTFYSAIYTVFFLLPWIWLIYTQARRHRIRDARTAIATRDQQIGSGGPQ